MGSTAEIRMHFPKEKHARWAMHVAEEMIKLIYAPQMVDPEQEQWIRAADFCPSLSQRYRKFRHHAAKLDPQEAYRFVLHTALDYLRRDRTWLAIDRCADVAGWSSFSDGEDLFPQLCFAYALRFPQVPFEAFFRYEMTVSGALQLFRAVYDGSVLHVQQKAGEWPMDETDWTDQPVTDYIARDGVFREKEREP